MRLRGTIGLFLALATVSWCPSAALAKARRHARCHSPKHVLVRRKGLVIWSRKGSVFACASPSHRTVNLTASQGAQGAVDPKVTDLRSAGRFAGFILTTHVEVDYGWMDVLNRDTGRLELQNVTECIGNDECDSGLVGTRLWVASNGWAAEQWNGLPTIYGASPDALLATNGTRTYELDLDNIGHVRLTGRTLRWTSRLGGASRAVLGRDLITPSTPTSRAGCQLLRSADLRGVLGTTTSSSSGQGQCTYTSSDDSGWQLSLQSVTGMSSAESGQQESNLQQAGWIDNTYGEPIQVWPNDSFYDLANPAFIQNQPSDQDQYAVFANGAEVELTLTLPGAITPRIDDGSIQIAHLATVAMDRLFGVPITRAR